MYRAIRPGAFLAALAVVISRIWPFGFALDISAHLRRHCDIAFSRRDSANLVMMKSVHAWHMNRFRWSESKCVYSA